LFTKLTEMKNKGKKKQILSVKTGKEFSLINPHAAGIDIGDTEHYVAIENDEGHEVRRFDAFTIDLRVIVQWLTSIGISTVAMESTGIYWLPLHLMLEEAGIEVYLVNAKTAKNVTGRKKDDSDAVWIQKLHRCGLLQKSFQPEHEYRTVRNYVRQRKNLVTICSDSVRRMQKALELMNIKVHTVISDLIGKSGMRIIASILAGERNLEVLAGLCDPRIQATKEEMIKSLEGIWSDDYLFMLKQAYDEYDFYQKQIKDCNKKIQEQLLKQIAIVKDGDISEVAQGNSVKKKGKKNQFDFDMTSNLIAITGVDLCKIPGVNEVTALELIAEIGTDMSKWPNTKHFAAWLNLAPNTKITGGKLISSKMMKKKNRAGQTLKMSASSLARNKTPLGDYYRRMRAKLGGKGAVLATAHKLARIIFVMLKNKKEYMPEMLDESQEQFKLKRIKHLEKQLAKLKQVA
jgi:transposase